MKVRVEFTVEVDEDDRKKIAESEGEEGLATRSQVREWFRRRACEMWKADLNEDE